MIPASTVSSPSPLALFLEMLSRDGVALVPPLVDMENPPVACPACEEILHRMDAGARQCLGENAPAFDPVAAAWAAIQFFHACQFLLCRDVPAEVVQQVLARPCPPPRNASVDYSVDIMFRYLPDLFRLAKRLAPGDALVDALKTWACEWPLSSVGIPLVTSDKAAWPMLDSFIDSPVLGRLYADRITAQSDTDRLADPRVQNLLRADIGMHDDLHPEISRKLRTDFQNTDTASATDTPHE